MPPRNNPSNGLPTGYTLDNSSASSASAGLPQGYALDATSNVPPGMEATGVPRAAGAPSSQPEMSQVGLLTGRPSEPITTKTPTQVVSQVGQNLGGMVDQISNSLHGRPNPPQQPLIDTSTPWSTVKDIMTAGPRSVYRQAAPIVQSMATPSPVPFLGNVATGALLNEASTTPEEGVNQPSINAAKAESQATLKRAIPPTKSAPYTDEQLSAAHPYIESEHAGSPIKSVEDLRDAQDAGVKKIEHTVSGYVAQNPNDLIQTHPGDAARAALAPTDKLRAGFLDQGMKELAPYHLDEPMTVAHADALRRQLNAENDAYAATNKYTYAQARATNPAFAAREAAVAALRDGVYKDLSDRGFADAAKLRNDEGALLATRNATQNQIFNGEKSVSGTGTNTPAGKMGQAAVRAATLGGGAGLGGYLGGVPGATAGGIIGGGLGEIINNVAFPGNMTRDALVESAFKNSPKSPLNTIRNAAAANTAPPAPPLVSPQDFQLTPPPGQTPPPVNTQEQLPLEPNEPDFQLTPPAGTTPPAILPRQAALPLTSSYAPMGEHAGLTSNIPGEAVPGQNLNLTGGNGINSPLQNLLDFSKEAHPEPTPLPKSLGAAAARPEPASVPGPLREAAGLPERRSIPRSMTMSQSELEDAIKNRKPISTPFSDTEGAMATINRDLNMPKAPGPVKLVPLSERPGAAGSVLSVKLKDGTAAGEVALRPNTDLGKGAWEVSTSYLKPEFRGKGFGNAAYQQMVDYAKQKGATALFSDDKVAPGAANVWDSMVKRGEAVWDPVASRYRVDLKGTK